MAEILKGNVIKYGDNVDTDVIIPARYCTSIDPDFLASHCMEDLDKDFHAKRKPGDIIVGGNNFGCGSSREVAPVAIKGAKISCVVAKSFARIFYRNAINIGLPILESPDAAEAAENGDLLEINIAKGTITNVTKNKTFASAQFPETMQEIIKAGGLVNFVRKKLGK